MYLLYLSTNISQPQKPITITPSLEWLFQQIVMDIFQVSHIAYLACADRLSDWLILYHLKPGHATISKLMSNCRQMFQTYCTPDKPCTNAELRYAPIESKTAAIGWALEKCHIFIMSCINVIEVTDHQPLMEIFGDRDFSKINTAHLFKLKEKCLQYFFNIQHCPGKLHKGAYVISCNSVVTVEALISPCTTHPSS